MEPLTSSKRLIILAAVLGLAATAGILSYYQINGMPFGKMLRSGLPMLDLTVVLRDLGNHNLAVSSTVLGNNEPPKSDDKRCPALIGGDTRSATIINSWDKRPSDCPQTAVWYVKKHPIGLTLYFNDGKDVLDWWDKDPQIKSLRDSRFMQGLFFGLLKSMKIKAEQLNVQGLQGEFLQQLLRDAIAANAELHYDMVHGEQGWVLSYQRGSTFTEQALPALAGLLASNGYRLENLPEPIVELRIGLQSFFVSEYQRRIYLAQSLEALINVLENQNDDEQHADAPLTLTLRPEAFVERLLPILTDPQTDAIELNFDLHDKHLGSLTLPAGSWQTPLQATIFEGVLASVPQNAFAAIAASYYLPPTLTLDDWKQFATKGPAPIAASHQGGLALVWDFDSTSAGGVVGIAIANPEQPEAGSAYQAYLRHSEFSDECAGGSVFLAASASGLLSRMKQACDRQALSPLDGIEKPRYLSAQLVSFINPGTALRELFLAGGAGNNDDRSDFAPRWRQEYEQAKTAMRQDGEKLFRSLPTFSYAGHAANGDRVRLEGRAISQEVVQ
jgi:hypothetical protein